MNPDFFSFSYLHKNSFFHRFDPGLKLFSILILIPTLFLVESFFSIFLFSVLVFILIVLSKIDFFTSLKKIKSIWFFVLLSFLFRLFYPEGKVLFSFLGIVITEISLAESIKISLKLIIMIEFSFLLTATTSPLSIAKSVETFLLRIKLPAETSHDISMVLSLAIRFIPIIGEESLNISRAQISRGARIDSGNILSRVRSFFTIIFPLFNSTIRRAEEISLAMEIRCYNGNTGRVRFKEEKARRKDWFFFLFCILFSVLIIFFDKKVL